MTDKQIKEVFKNGFYCIEPCPEIKELQAELKRKEQECEAYKMEAEEGKEINAELKAENEELKEKNRQLTILGMDLNQNNEVLRKSFFATDKSRDYWREQAEKLKQTLTEIKEIAEKLKNFYEELGKCEDLTVVRLKQILQKISEVEDGV